MFSTTSTFLNSLSFPKITRRMSLPKLKIFHRLSTGSLPVQPIPVFASSFTGPIHDAVIFDVDDCLPHPPPPTRWSSNASSSSSSSSSCYSSSCRRSTSTTSFASSAEEFPHRPSCLYCPQSLYRLSPHNWSTESLYSPTVFTDAFGKSMDFALAPSMPSRKRLLLSLLYAEKEGTVMIPRINKVHLNYTLSWVADAGGWVLCQVVFGAGRSYEMAFVTVREWEMEVLRIFVEGLEDDE